MSESESKVVDSVAVVDGQKHESTATTSGVTSTVAASTVTGGYATGLEVLGRTSAATIAVTSSSIGGATTGGGEKR